MVKMPGYMVTWTTYGSWLQGDIRGYVKGGQILSDDLRMKRANLKRQKIESVTLTEKEKRIVYKTILAEADRIKSPIKALAVCSNHVHIATECGGESIENIVRRYKNVSSSALRKHGRDGRVWTRGFDKRYCFDKEELEKRINYVRAHNKG
jgi:REP element-mobilizing transposase RayT